MLNVCVYAHNMHCLGVYIEHMVTQWPLSPQRCRLDRHERSNEEVQNLHDTTYQALSGADDTP